MVDPQWYMLYWGSRCILHTACWGGVGCEWGTISVYFGITYICFILEYSLSFVCSPSTNIDFFIYVKNIIWSAQTKSSLAQIMAWCLMVPSHFLNQCWLEITSRFSRGQWVNDTDDIWLPTFLNTLSALANSCVWVCGREDIKALHYWLPMWPDITSSCSVRRVSTVEAALMGPHHHVTTVNTTRNQF